MSYTIVYVCVMDASGLRLTGWQIWLMQLSTEAEGPHWPQSNKYRKHNHNFNTFIKYIWYLFRTNLSSGQK